MTSSGEYRDSQSRDSKWSCEYCTYENYAASKKCTLCHAPRRPQYIDEAARHGEDIYQMAPLISPPSSGCQSPVSHAKHTSDEWACRMCTFINQSRAANCIQCLTSRNPPMRLGDTSTNQAIGINESIDCIGNTSSQRNSPNSPEAAKASNNDKNKIVSASKEKAAGGAVVQKWPCKACTYDNWPRSMKCVICGIRKSHSTELLVPSSASPPPQSPSYHDSSSERSESRNRQSPPARRVEQSKSQSPERDDQPAIISASSDINRRPVDEKQRQENQALSREVRQGSNREVRQNESQSRAEHRTDDQSTATTQEDEDRKRQLVASRLRDIDWLFLTACRAIVDGDEAHEAVEAFVAAGGDVKRRHLTADETLVLGRPSAVNYTLVHLAVRFQREDILALLLTLVDTSQTTSGTPGGCSGGGVMRKRMPSYAAPDLAAEITVEISMSLRQRKGDFPCYFMLDISTFALPSEIETFPNSVKKQLFEELLDRNAQKELEDDEPVINWSRELMETLGSRLYPLWNRTAGDCLLDSLLQVTWGVMDRDNTLRRALADSLNEGTTVFYPRFKYAEALQASLLNFSIEEQQFERDWAYILSLANKPGTALEQIHVFALAHILRRPIIIYGIKYIKSLSGDNIGYAKFQGVYLPLLWEQSFCWRSPVALGYTRGHFNALVPLQADMYAGAGAQANIDNSDRDDIPTAYLPLMDCEGKLIPIHFLQASEIGHEHALLHEWLDCCVTDGGILVAKQTLPRPPRCVHQMLDDWLHRYRRLAHMVDTSGGRVAPAGRGHPVQVGHSVRGGHSVRMSPAVAVPVSSDEESDDE